MQNESRPNFTKIEKSEVFKIDYTYTPDGLGFTIESDDDTGEIVIHSCTNDIYKEMVGFKITKIGEITLSNSMSVGEVAKLIKECKVFYVSKQIFRNEENQNANAQNVDPNEGEDQEDEGEENEQNEDEEKDDEENGEENHEKDEDKEDENEEDEETNPWLAPMYYDENEDEEEESEEEEEEEEEEESEEEEEEEGNEKNKCFSSTFAADTSTKCCRIVENDGDHWHFLQYEWRVLVKRKDGKSYRYYETKPTIDNYSQTEFTIQQRPEKDRFCDINLSRELRTRTASEIMEEDEAEDELINRLFGQVVRMVRKNPTRTEVLSEVSEISVENEREEERKSLSDDGMEDFDDDDSNDKISKIIDNIRLKQDYGFVYCLENPLFPNLLKIGRTGNLKARMSNLNTGVPENYKLVCACLVNNHIEKEKKIHRLLDDDRHNGKEFFSTSTKKIKELFDIFGGIYTEEISKDLKVLCQGSQYQKELINLWGLSLLELEKGKEKSTFMKRNKKRKRT